MPKDLQKVRMYVQHSTFHDKKVFKKCVCTTLHISRQKRIRIFIMVGQLKIQFPRVMHVQQDAFFIILLRNTLLSPGKWRKWELSCKMRTKMRIISAIWSSWGGIPQLRTFSQKLNLLTTVPQSQGDPKIVKRRPKGNLILSKKGTFLT